MGETGYSDRHRKYEALKEKSKKETTLLSKNFIKEPQKDWGKLKPDGNRVAPMTPKAGVTVTHRRYKNGGKIKK